MTYRATRFARDVTLLGVKLHRSLGGALAGGVAATVWAAQQPLDKRAFGSYDDVELLGKLVTRGTGGRGRTRAARGNGAVFGAVYAQLRPFVPGPPVAAGSRGAGRARGSGRSALVDRYHPARKELGAVRQPPRLRPGRLAAPLFGLVLGGLERRLNDERRRAARCPSPRTDTATSSARPPRRPEPHLN